MAMMPKNEGPWWETGVLRPDVHDQLVQNRASIAGRSGLGERNLPLMWTSMPKDVSDAERAWLVSCIKHESVVSLVYGGSADAAAERFMVYAGYLLRNFVDARVLGVGELNAILMEYGDTDAEVLLVPDFVLPGEPARTERQRNAVMEVLRRRMRQGEPTILFMPKTATKPWGEAFHNELNRQFSYGGDL